MYCPVMMFVVNVIFNIIPHIILYSVIMKNTHMDARERFDSLFRVFFALFMYKSYNIIKNQENLYTRFTNYTDMCYDNFYSEDMCWIDM